MRIASTNTQLDSVGFIRTPVPSCAGQLEVTFKTRSIAGQNVPMRARRHMAIYIITDSFWRCCHQNESIISTTCSPVYPWPS
jgi:hypothetical protein